MSVAGWHFTLNLAGVGSSLADVSGAMMRRRDFLQFGSGAAVAWSMPAWAQQVSSLPLVAVLLPGSTEGVPERVAAVRKGLVAGPFACRTYATRSNWHVCGFAVALQVTGFLPLVTGPTAIYQR
jgi:hypothetical protein